VKLIYKARTKLVRVYVGHAMYKRTILTPVPAWVCLPYTLFKNGI